MVYCPHIGELPLSQCNKKIREEQVSNTVDFSPNFTIPCMPLGDSKQCAAHYLAQLLLPKSFQTHTMYQIHKKIINPIDIVNIPPAHQPEKITKVSTTERNRTHNSIREININLMGITSTGRNTVGPRTKTNPPMVPRLQGLQVQHLMMVIYCLCSIPCIFKLIEVSPQQSIIVILTFE